MENKMEEMRIVQIVHLNITQSKKIAIELKKIFEQKGALQDSINKSRRELNFHIEGAYTEADIIGQLFDYLKLEEMSKSLSVQLSSCVSLAVSYLCELINDNTQGQGNYLNFISEFMQIRLVVSNTIRLGVDYSSLMPGLCKAHVLLSEQTTPTNHSSLSSVIFEIIRDI